MRLEEIVRSLDLTVHTGAQGLDRVVTGGYVGDLMSDVIARAPAGCVWVTIQAHANMVAVAMMRELAGVVIAGGKAPEPEAMERARTEGVALLGSPLGSFEVVARLAALGVGAHGDARGA